MPFDGIMFDIADLKHPIAHADALLRRHAETYVLSLANAYNRSVIAQVQQLTAALLPTGRCTAALVAQQLGISRSTLNRRLCEQDTSFSAILDSLRCELAIRACSGDLTLTQIAEQLGYADLNSFSRWFSKMLGKSPSNFRAESKLC